MEGAVNNDHRRAEEAVKEVQVERRKRNDQDEHGSRLVVEKSAEWGEDLWLATLDVEKAFDKVHHLSSFDALVGNGVDDHSVAALKGLFTGTQAYVQVWPGEQSRTFPVERGVC